MASETFEDEDHIQNIFEAIKVLLVFLFSGHVLFIDVFLLANGCYLFID